MHRHTDKHKHKYQVIYSYLTIQHNIITHIIATYQDTLQEIDINKLHINKTETYIILTRIHCKAQIYINYF